MPPRKHISFSEIKDWDKCAFYHKLVYIDRLSGFEGNEYTAFGSALHHVCEVKVANPKNDKDTLFEEKFLEELTSLPSNVKENLNKKLVSDMRSQGKDLVPLITPALKEEFGDFEVISVEEELYETLHNFDKKFKGFIDLVLKTSDGKYHVIDWKTCSWGWNQKRKNSPMTTYQLTYYKHFFAAKHDINPDSIETHFALLKRTAKKNKIEIFRVTSGKRKTENALNFLEKVVYNVKNKNYIKNKTSCQRCNFYKTAHCT